MDRIIQHIYEDNEFLKLVDKYLDIPELDAAILNELVSKSWYTAR